MDLTPKFTYLIGAGASAKVLPLAKKVSDSILDLPSSMFNLTTHVFFTEIKKPQLKEKCEMVFEDFKLYSEKAKSFGTIDTLAKYYFLTDKESYKKLKHTLSAYFLIEQLIFDKLDERYLSFITSICDHTFFPFNVQVISWNYDFQFQLAYFQLFGNEKVGRIMDGVSVSNDNGLSYYPSPGNHFPQTADNFESGFRLVQLNGIAGFSFNPNEYWTESFFAHSNSSDKEEMLEKILSDSAYNTLSFAWESPAKPHPLVKRTQIATKKIEDTDYLIVIGYSFPFFNRKVDTILFESLLKKSSLKKIYFQDPFLDGEYLRSQFNLPDSIIIKHIPNVDQFYIPYEL